MTFARDVRGERGPLRDGFSNRYLSHLPECGLLDDCLFILL